MLSIPSDPVIQLGRASDHSTAALALAAAFDKDPVTSFCVRADARHWWAMQLAFKQALDIFQPYELTFVANDGQGAALWARHDQWRLTFWQEWRLIPLYIRVCGVDRFMRLDRGFDSMKSHHPTVPHYYLYLLGVHPDHQLQGLGSALLCTMLERCDNEHMPAYLEASSPRNIPFYRRHGFQVIEEFTFGPAGPPLAAMWRSPS